jgi:hypothetical protein
MITYRQLMRAKVLHLLAMERPWARRLRMRRERFGRR